MLSSYIKAINMFQGVVQVVLIYFCQNVFSDTGRKRGGRK